MRKMTEAYSWSPKERYLTIPLRYTYQTFRYCNKRLRNLLMIELEHYTPCVSFYAKSHPDCTENRTPLFLTLFPLSYITRPILYSYLKRYSIRADVMLFYFRRRSDQYSRYLRNEPELPVKVHKISDSMSFLSIRDQNVSKTSYQQIVSSYEE